MSTHKKPNIIFAFLVTLTATIIFFRVGRAKAEDRSEQNHGALARPLRLTQPVQDKNFYLLSLLEHDKVVRKALYEDATLRGLYESKLETLKRVFEQSKLGDAHALADLEFTEAEIVQGEHALTQLYGRSVALRKLVDGPLRQSGIYLRYQTGPSGETGATLVSKAWRDCALGINNIVSVYGLGKNGRSPDIDSISYDAKSFLYGALVHNILGALLEELGALPAERPKESGGRVDNSISHPIVAVPSVFAPSLKCALGLMEANRRDEAGRFEPLERGENRAALRRVPSIRWEQYPYTVIIVPGYGPEEPGVSLSPIGKLGLSLAVRRYKDGKAPFILVSGGYVHPKQTPYCEAFEMKRSLIHDFGVPESAIIMDPHARHTTTNLRNAVRLLFRYGIPCERPGLITTNTYQSADIEGVAFRDRCQRVFGYQPVEVLARLSPFDITFRPKLDSLYADPQDPLDP